MDLNSRRAWYAFGLWLRVVIIGVGVVATGFAHLFDRTATVASALAWLIGGGVVAAFARYRASAALGRVGRSEEAAKVASNDGLRVEYRAAPAASDSLAGLSQPATVLE